MKKRGRFVIMPDYTYQDDDSIYTGQASGLREALLNKNTLLIVDCLMSCDFVTDEEKQLAQIMGLDEEIVYLVKNFDLKNNEDNLGMDYWQRVKKLRNETKKSDYEYNNSVKNYRIKITEAKPISNGMESTEKSNNTLCVKKSSGGVAKNILLVMGYINTSHKFLDELIKQLILNYYYNRYEKLAEEFKIAEHDTGYETRIIMKINSNIFNVRDILIKDGEVRQNYVTLVVKEFQKK